MNEIFITVILPALVGAIAGYAGALGKSALDMRAKVDEELRTTRAGAYKTLWLKTGLLPRWPRATDVSYEDLAKLSRDFREWYYNDGGIYLSHAARKVYGDTQTALIRAIEKGNTGNVIDEDYDALREQLSLLRTELTNDLLSRRRSFLI